MEEKGNIESKVLKGGVSYNKYVWHSENGEHTCDVCSELDGQEFDYYDEVPERPHPNCKCYVEIVENIRTAIVQFLCTTYCLIIKNSII